MEFNYKPQQRLVVELSNNKIYEGDCRKCAKNRIDLVNVIAYPDGKKLKGHLSFYSCEIFSVRVLEKVSSNDGGESDDASSTALSVSPTNRTISTGELIAVPREEYNRLLNMTQNYIYMATLDYRYVNAVDHLANCETVGVVGIDIKSGRKNRLSLLVICSWDQVYIFDLLLFHKKTFEPELKDILQSKKIKKVVHDSRKLTDCLEHCHKVKLNNVFDTAVANLMIEKKETGVTPTLLSNISQSLRQFLNFPTSLLENALEVTTSEWQDRPILPSKKVMAAQLATFLISLKDKQEQILLKEYNKAVEIFSRLSVDMDDYELANSTNKEYTVPERMKKFI